MSGFLTEMVQWLVTVLPADPIRPYLAQFSALPHLGWLNWLFPVGSAVGILGSWLAGITAWYAWSALARFLHLTD